MGKYGKRRKTVGRRRTLFHYKPFLSERVGELVSNLRYVRYRMMGRFTGIFLPGQ